MEEQPQTTPVEPPRGFFSAHVDDKGRLKLPVDLQQYLTAIGDEKLFVTSVDDRIARIYPISVWKANEFLFANAGDLAEVAEDVAYVAKVFGGDSDIDAQGRVLMPAALRRELALESQTVYLDCYNGRINVAGKSVHDARFHRAMANLGEKVKTLDKKGLK